MMNQAKPFLVMEAILSARLEENYWHPKLLLVTLLTAYISHLFKGRGCVRFYLSLAPLKNAFFMIMCHKMSDVGSTDLYLCKVCH